jgi:tetratricopeptide (TPR) repeat protein
MQRFKTRAADLLKRYTVLVAASEVADEARLRLGALQYRLGSLDDALAVLAPLRQSTDPHVAYVAEFLTGEARRSEGRGAEAQAAYRQALTFAPNAMSASLGLSSVLAASGNIDGAIAAASGAATTAAPVDPWRVFAYGSGSQWPRWRDSLRREMRR